MKFGPSRGNPIILFEHFFKDFGLLIIALIISIWKGPDILLKNIAVLVICFIRPITSLSKYFFTKYSIDGEKMIINSGLFVKKTMEIPLKVITTVDLSQNLMFQLFHVYKIKADNSSQTHDNAKQAEIELALKEDQAFYVKSLLESKEETDITEAETIQPVHTTTPVINCSLIDFIKLGALQSKILYFFTVVSLMFGGGGYISQLLSEELDVSKHLEKFINVLSPVLGITILFLVTYLFSLLSSVVLTAVRYYNYTVLNREDALLVQYGLLTKKSYTLMKQKISGINIKQSLLMRILGYCTVEVFIIGYGDESDGQEKEISLLYPIARLDQVDKILQQLFPGMTFDRDFHKKQQGSLRYYFYCFRMFFAIAIVIGTIAALSILKVTSRPITVAATAGSIAFFVLIIISIYLEYFNSGIFTRKNEVAICKGILSLKMIYIKSEKLESITEYASAWKHRNGFTNIKLGFLAPIRVANMNARNIRYQDYLEIQKVINF